MTLIKFLADGKGINGFEVSGHSTDNCDDLEGKLVCSAVSSAAYMAANTVIEVAGDFCDTKIDDALMRLTVDNPSDTSRAVLEGFRLHIKQLAEQYGKRIRIISEV